MVLASVLLLLLLIVCCFAPGFFFIRRLRWTPMEKLCGSIGLSVILLYLVTWGLYVLGGVQRGHIPVGVLATTSIICALLGIAARRDVLRLLHSFRVKHSVLGYAFLCLWTFLLLSMIRVYSGGTWSADWLEHFQRTLFFLWRFPANTTFIDVYPLPARPPLMNVVAAYFLAQTQDRFELFQLVFSFLNLLIFLPCCLILPVITRAYRSAILILVTLFSLNPMLMENVTYAWTKALAGFFVLLGLAFYLAAWRKQDHSRMLAAFVSMAAGLLVHYSAGPYAVFLGLHYVLSLFWKRPGRWRELAAILVICLALLTTWFAWSIKTYGAATFLSNTSVTTTNQYEGNNADKIAANTYDTLVPYFIRNWSLTSPFEQRNMLGRIRDDTFIVYQTNILFAAGIIGGPLLLWQLFTRFGRNSWRRKSERRFWMSFVLFCPILGIAVVGERDNYGVAHLTLLALVALSLTVLVEVFSQRKIIRYLLIAGCLFDFYLGIFLNAHVQNLENAPETRVFDDIEFSGSELRYPAGSDSALSHFAWINWYQKHTLALSEKWINELPERNRNNPRFQAIWPAERTALLKGPINDANAWGGWYSRHGGEIQYIGDHISGTLGEGIVASILLALSVTLVVTTVRQMRSKR